MDQPKKKNGGKRPGAGRKKAVVEAAKLLTAKDVYEALEASVGPSLKLLLDTVKSKDKKIELETRLDAAKFILNKVLNQAQLAKIVEMQTETTTGGTAYQRQYYMHPLDTAANGNFASKPIVPLASSDSGPQERQDDSSRRIPD